MKDKIIKIKDNSMVYFDDKVLGIDGENLQGKIIFYFENFKNGVAWLEFEKEDGTKKYIPMNKVNETYEVEIKSSLLSNTSILYLQLRITEDEDVNGIPVFKSNKFYMNVLSSINATSTIEDDYPNILDVLNNKQDKLEAGENITIEDNVISADIKGIAYEKDVDEKDAETLKSAKKYTDDEVEKVKEEKVDKVKGKDLSSNDFTNAYKKKLDELNNYNDTALKEQIENINEEQKDQNTEIEKIKEENIKLKSQIPNGQASGNSIHIEDSSDLEFDWKLNGGHKQETREGSNLLDFNVKQNSNNVTINDDGTITINGSGGFSLVFKEIALKAGTTYYEKYEVISGSVKNTIDGISIFMEPTSKRFIEADTFEAFSVEEDKNVKSIWVHVNAVFTNAKIKIWANTDKSDFEQYGASPSPDYSSEIKTVGSNVNLADKDNITKLYFNQNQISIGATSKTMVENCLPNTTYVISKIKSTKFRVCTTNKTPQANENIVDYIYNDSGDKITITTSDKAKYMCIYFYDSATDTLDEQDILDSIKIEKGKVATPYSPYNQGSVEVNIENKNIFDNLYTTITKDGITVTKNNDGTLTLNGTNATSWLEHKTQSYIMPVQQEMLEGDYIEDVEHHEWGKLVLTGEEIILRYSTNTSDVYRFAIQNIDIPNQEPTVKSLVFCNILKNVTAMQTYLGTEGISGYKFQIIAYIKKCETMTIEEFKAWLKEKYDSGNPVVVYYKLAEPVNLELTSEQKAIREKQLCTYKNITNINLSDELASIDVTYKKDLEAEHNKLQEKNDNLQSQIDEIKQLLSTTQTSALLLDNLQKDIEMEVE